ncbi:MAG: BTAD domain-containing putative transcriptional regulator [Hyphomicrobiales bacterium]
MSGKVQIRLLGPLGLTLPNGKPIKIGSRRALALVAYVARAPGKSVFRDKLADLLWSDSNDERARNSLRQTLTALRHDLGPLAGLLSANGDAIGIDSGNVAVDADRLVSAVEGDDLWELDQACTDHGGKFLDGFVCGSEPFDEWVLREREMLQNTLIAALDRLARKSQRGVPYARRLIALDPNREASYRLAMELLAAEGLREEAHRVYEACREMLARELGIDPSPETLAVRDMLLGEPPSPTTALRTATPGEPRHPPPKPAHEPATIGLMGFANLTGERRDDYLAEGLVLDIMTALGEHARFAVVSRLPLEPGVTLADAARIGVERGVKYLFGGSIQRSSSRLRVNLQLIETATGHLVWSERFDLSEDGLLDFQDTVAQAAALAVSVELQLSNWQIRDKSPPGSAEVRLLVNRALTKYSRMTAEALIEARVLAEQAHAVDPSNPRAARMLALAISAGMTLGIVRRTPAAIDQAIDLAQTAVATVPDDELARCVLAWALSVAGRNEEAIVELKHAIAINPVYPDAHSDIAEQYALTGQSAKAIAYVKTSMELAPTNPSDYRRQLVLAIANFGDERYAAAVEAARSVIRAKPGYIRGAIYWAASAAGAGYADEATRAINHCLALMPDLRLANVSPGLVTRYVDDARHRRFLELLKKAGLPA